MTMALLVLVAAGGVTSSPNALQWEKVFEEAASASWVSGVWALGRDDWFASGKWGVAKAGKAGVEREATTGTSVLGLFGQAADSVYALGVDELVLHFDGKRWSEEHRGPQPKRPGRGGDLLHSAFFSDAAAGPSLVAFGPSLTLVRQPNGSWIAPPAKEMKRISLLSQVGPTLPLPARCDEAGWHWLGKDSGWFFCHDGRTFTFSEGAVAPKGKLPRACRKSLDSVVTGNGEIYATCAAATVWKTEGQTWRLLATMKGEKELPSISVTAACVFVSGRRTIWRSCRP
jgi:hypothetical protein